jgi:hypothetical protein
VRKGGGKRGGIAKPGAHGYHFQAAAPGGGGERGGGEEITV